MNTVLASASRYSRPIYATVAGFTQFCLRYDSLLVPSPPRRRLPEPPPVVCLTAAPTASVISAVIGLASSHNTDKVVKLFRDFVCVDSTAS